MPDPENIKHQAVALQTHLAVEYLTKDWRKRSYEDVRKFLHFLFSDNPQKNNYGIFVEFKNNKWYHYCPVVEF